MKDALEELCDYTEGWRRRFAEVTKETLAADPGGWSRPIKAGDAGVGHGSLRDTLVHIVLVEDDWQQVDLDGNRDVDLEVEYSAREWPDVDSILFDRGAEIRASLRARIPTWAEPVHLPERDFDTTVGDVLMHVLLHEVAHHGDLTTILSALHAPDWGYFFVRHRMTQAGRR